MNSMVIGMEHVGIPCVPLLTGVSGLYAVLVRRSVVCVGSSGAPRSAGIDGPPDGTGVLFEES